MKKKIYFFKFDTSRQDFFLPMIWFGFKRYYEVNGKYPDQWEWIPPVLDYIGWTVDEIVKEAVSHKADVYAFNSYMWSWNIIKIVAKKIKTELPDSITVLGGPHQGTTWTDPIFWFKKYPYFDATCTPTEYGEWFLLDLLDGIIENNLDWNKVRNSYHRLGKGPVEDKRKFIFPSKVLGTNLDIALEYSDRARELNKPLTVLFETNRGCPYGCMYCEWGGGINTKVVPNPIDNIKDELSYFPLLGVKSVYITDANFGILKRDEEIAELFCTLKDTLNDIYIGGLAKTSNEKRKKVLQPLIEAGLVTSYQMSIQSVNPEVLKNIDRTDITVEENVALAKELISKYDIGVNVELITGLPGYKLEDFYQEVDVVYEVFNKYGGVTRAPLFILPDSPAANPEYIAKHGLQLVPIGMEGEGGEQESSQGKDYLAIYDNEIVSENITFIPVASKSYSVRDWKEIFFMTDMDMLFNNQHLLKPLIDFLFLHRNKKPSQLVKTMYNILISIPDFYDPIESYLDNIAQGKSKDRDWRALTAPGIGYQNFFRVYMYLWNKHRTEIFEKIRENLLDVRDDVLLDCIEYVENSTFRDDQSVVWTNKFRWDLWETGKDKSIMPEQSSITLNTSAKTIDWYSLDNKFLRTVFTKRDNGSKIKLRTL